MATARKLARLARRASGRPALEGAREPSGRLSRSAHAMLGSTTPAEARRLREAALSGLREPFWGTQLGRLMLDGKLTAQQFGAGRSWDNLIAQWRATHCGPRFNPKAGLSSLHRVDGGGGGSSERADRSAQLAAELVDDAISAFIDGSRDPRLVAVRQCVEQDLAPAGVEGFNRLADGLSVLADHWRRDA